MTTFSPGAVAKQSGFTLETLRYYERIGLLTDIDRDSSGRRSFTEDDVHWLGVLKCLRDTGMPIAQMLRYAEMPSDPDGLRQRIAILHEHDASVDAQIVLLQAQRKRLQQKISGYQNELDQLQ